MPGFFNKYPYTDFHELNLDYILSQMKALIKAFEDFVGINTITFSNPILWSITREYGKNVVVIDTSGNAYLSLQIIPAGIPLTNTLYWMEIFNFTGFITAFDSNITFNMEFDTAVATADYIVDDWILIDNILYRVKAAITAGDTFVEGTNIERFTLEQFIKAWITSCTQLINQYKNDIDASEVAYRNQLAQDIADTTQALNDRLDLAISGVTVDSEVIDARLGADGITYSTLGTADRMQFSNLSHEDAELAGGVYGLRTLNLFNKNDIDIIEDGFLDGSGNFVSNANFNETGFIPCQLFNPDLTYRTYTFSANGALLGSSRVVCFYDKEKNLIQGSANPLPTINAYNADTYYFRFPYLKTEADTLMILENDTSLQAYVNFYSGASYPGQDLICIGDSICYNDGRTVNSEYRVGYPAYIKALGYTVNNAAVSGACVAYHSDRPYEDNVTTVSNTSFSSYDAVIFQGGVNDYITSSPMGSIGSGPYDDTTFYGAYQKIIDKVLTDNNKIQIYLMTPVRTFITAYDVTNGGPNAQSLYLKDYADAVKAIGKHYSLPVIDLFDNAGINPYNIDDYTDDKLHLNNAGYLRACNIMVPGLKDLTVR